MAATTKVNTEWAVRLLIIAIAALVFGAWFTYDGAYAWPRLNRMGELAYRKTQDARGEVRWVERDEAVWKKRLAAEGFPNDQLPDPPRPEADITMQFVYAAICFPVALVMFINLQIHAARKLYTDERGLHRGRRSIAFDQIQRIDYDRWDAKGIAVVHGADNTRIKLDDWKYKGAASVLADVEARVPHLARSTPSPESDSPPESPEPPESPQSPESPEPPESAESASASEASRSSASGSSPEPDTSSPAGSSGQTPRA